MKKLIAVLLITTTLVISCTKNDDLTAETKNERISKVLNEKNIDNQKLMYKMLSKEEKYTIWTNRINSLISKKNISHRQITLLQELKKHLSVTLFDEMSKNNEKEIFKNIYVKDFLHKAKNEFSADLIYVNFFTISGRYAPIDGGGGLSICGCNIGSMWSCGMGTTECKATSKCELDNDGCGFAGMFECNGNCFNN